MSGDFVRNLEATRVYLASPLAAGEHVSLNAAFVRELVNRYDRLIERVTSLQRCPGESPSSSEE